MSRRIIATYYAIGGLFTLAAALIWGVNTLFLLDAGLNILEVFIANAAFTAGMVLFEIPTGVLADTAGRRLSFLLAVFTLAVTTLAYLACALAHAGVIWFSVVSVFIGLGFTFYSGAVDAWLVDALKASGYQGALDKVFAGGAMVSGAAMLVGTLLGGVLGDIDLSIPYLVRSASLFAAFAVGWLYMRDQGYAPRALRLAQVPAEMRAVARASIQYGWRERPVRLLMYVSFLQYGFMIWAFYAWQPYFLRLWGSDAVWVAGAAASVIAAAGIAGNSLVAWASRFCRKRTTLLMWSAGIQAVAAVGVGLTHSFAAALVLFIILAMAMGVGGPVKQTYLHGSIPSEQRASVVSFDSLFGNAGGIVQQTGLGYIAKAQSIEQGYVTGGLFTLLAVPIFAVIRGLKKPADEIPVPPAAPAPGAAAPA